MPGEHIKTNIKVKHTCVLIRDLEIARPERETRMIVC